MSETARESPSPAPDATSLQREVTVSPGAVQPRDSDQVLNSRTKQNRELGIETAEYATSAALRDRPDFNARKKLILSQVLKLVADSLNPARKEDFSQDRMLARQRNLKAAIRVGKGQMLRRLRCREKLVNQLMLWKANSRNPGAATLRDNQVSILLGPNRLIDPVFQKVVAHEMDQSNGKIARGRYRSFMFLPVQELQGGSSSLIPYLRMANRRHFHILGGLRVEDSLDELGRLRDEWRLRLNDVSPEEQEILADATLIANEIVIRPPYREYGETEPLTCVLPYGLAAQMTRYFQRKKDGDWYISMLHPTKSASDLSTVNLVSSVRDQQHEFVKSRFCLGYTVLKSEEEDSAGVRVYGVVTTFPEDQIDLKELGNQAVPMIQSQARVTQNRIYFYLVTQMERFIGGSIAENEVRGIVQKYLENMKLQNQIEGFNIVRCKKDETGKFRIQVAVKWAANARMFEIDLNESAVDGADG